MSIPAIKAGAAGHVYCGINEISQGWQPGSSNLAARLGVILGVFAPSIVPEDARHPRGFGYIKPQQVGGGRRIGAPTSKPKLWAGLA